MLVFMAEEGEILTVNVAGKKRHSSNYNMRLEVNTTLTRVTNKLVLLLIYISIHL
jgi:hypothetical protein